jgi:thymidylate synthase (FAD)
MKIIEPSFEIVDPKTLVDGVSLLQKIEYMARISHRSEEKQTDDSYDRFIRAVVIGHGDWSVVEHASATVIFRVDRGVTHELVRHRLFSFTQESTRFVSYGGKMVGELEFIVPSGFEYDQQKVIWKQQMFDAESQYQKLIGYNTRPQEARSILPNSLAATIAVTGNLRNWRHFLLMRTSKETHPDFRKVTIPLLTEFQKRIPILYEDILPEQRQIENMEKAR